MVRTWRSLTQRKGTIYNYCGAWGELNVWYPRITLVQSVAAAIPRQSVEQFLDRWLSDSVKPSVRPKTFSGYSQLVKLHIELQLGRLSLQKAGPEHTQAFLNDRHAAGAIRKNETDPEKGLIATFYVAWLSYGINLPSNPRNGDDQWAIALPVLRLHPFNRV